MSLITKAPKFNPIIKQLFLPSANFRAFRTGQNRTNVALLGTQQTPLFSRKLRPATPFMTQVMYKSDSDSSSNPKDHKLKVFTALLGVLGGGLLIFWDKRSKQKESEAIIKRGNEIYETLLSQMPDKPFLADHRFREELETNLSMRMLDWNMDTQQLVMARHFIAFAESVHTANASKPASEAKITFYDAYAAYKNLRAQLRDYKNTELSINDKHLTMLPLEIYFVPLKKLEITAPISDLPNRLDYVPLTHLTVQSPCLNQFPSVITHLSHLSHLTLAHNKIQLIPHEISHLTKLEVLDLSFNKLSKLPESMNDLTELRRLNLAGNQFRRFPDQISQLRKLSLVNLENQNPSTS